MDETLSIVARRFVYTIETLPAGRDKHLLLKDRARGQILKNAFSVGGQRPPANVRLRRSNSGLRRLCPRALTRKRGAIMALVATGADLRNLPATFARCLERAAA